MNPAFHELNTHALLIALSIVLSAVLILCIILTIGVLKKVPRSEKAKKESYNISRILLDCLEKKITTTVAIKKLENVNVESLLKQLIAFEDRFNNHDWNLLKHSVAEQYLLPLARTYVKSYSWVKRNFAANSFALVPLFEDMKDILLLVDDQKFLVSSIAAIAALELEQKESLIKIIRKMSETKGFAHCYYRDLILQQFTPKNALLVEKIASECKEESIHLACLNLLVGKSLDFSFPFVWDDLQSENRDIRIAAIKLLVRYPQEMGLSLCLKWLEDPDEQIRIEAIKGLEYFRTPEIFKRLTNCLSDESWKVRSQAASTLKKLVPQGIEILKSQDPTQNPRAYEVAQYTLKL